MNIMTMKKTNAKTYPHSISLYNPPTLMIIDKMKAAINPPIMLPRPPKTQIMKVMGPKLIPTNG